jgi:RecA/RadA recombinase
MSLLDKLRKNSTIKEASVLSDTSFFDGKDVIQTQVPALNIALSGSLDGGFKGGVGLIAGPSRHFKSSIMLLLASAFQKKHKDSIIVFLDAEFGSPPEYFKSFGIDLERVLHVPIVNIEQMKSEVMNQLSAIERNDKVMFIVDSLGNLASAKEIQDALDEKSAADFTRAKQFKSFFRMITPILSMKDIPFVAIAHTYETMEMYSKQIVSGGQALMLASDWVIIVGKQQEKDGTELLGYNFILNIEKSRLVREKSKIPLQVRFDGGISKWSGLMDIALESGYVIKPSNGWFSRVIDKESGETEEKKWRLKDTDNSEFWGTVLSNKGFREWVETRYKIANASMISDDTPKENEEDLE